MASDNLEVHHAAPRCLLRLYDQIEDNGSANDHVQALLEFELGAARWGVPVSIPRADLEALVERSAVLLEREAHRLLHQNDWQRWGSRGGRETLRRYGSQWFSLLAPKVADTFPTTPKTLAAANPAA